MCEGKGAFSASTKAALASLRAFTSQACGVREEGSKTSEKGMWEVGVRWEIVVRGDVTFFLMAFLSPPLSLRERTSRSGLGLGFEIRNRLLHITGGRID